LHNHDDLADDPEDLSSAGAEFEEFAYVASRIYEEKVGDIPNLDMLEPLGDPTGTDWEEDGDVFRSRWPKLYRKYWEA
jgi:hypothetical protein